MKLDVLLKKIHSKKEIIMTVLDLERKQESNLESEEN
jgi:hypothetical protein